MINQSSLQAITFSWIESPNYYDLYLVKTNEGGNSDVLFFKKRYTFLSCVNGIHHNVVKSTTARGNGHIILLIYGSKVSLQAQQ